MNEHQAPLGAVGLAVAIAMAVCSFAVAVWTSALIVPSCINAVKLRNAELVDARILNIERRMVGSGDGRREEVTVTYSYEFEGELFEHRTSRLALFAMGREVAQKLEAAYSAGELVPCHVDPDQPSVSVFSKEFSASLLIVSLMFPIAFGSVAVMITKSLVRRFRKRH